MKVPLRGRGGKQDTLKECKSAFSFRSAVIHLNFFPPVWGSGMSQWSPTPLLCATDHAVYHWKWIWFRFVFGGFLFFLWQYGKHSIRAEDFPLKSKSGFHLLPSVICWMHVCPDGSSEKNKKTSSYSTLDLKIAGCYQVAALKCFSPVPLNTIRITCKWFCVLYNVCHFLAFFSLHAKNDQQWMPQLVLKCLKIQQWHLTAEIWVFRCVTAEIRL